MGRGMIFELPTEEQKIVVRKQLGTSKEDIRQAVTNIRNWLRAQPHLPQVIDDDRLERMYIGSKCHIEKVKTMLDAYYTLKSKFPETLMNRDPLGDDMSKLPKYVKLLAMPRLTPDSHRVFVLTGLTSEVSPAISTRGVKAALMIVDFLLSFDYSVGSIAVIDLKNVTAAHVATLTVRDVRALDIICRRAYSRRIKTIHFVNAPKIVDKVLSLVKFSIPEKIQKRILIHTSESRTLFDHLPAQLVPNELGGTGGSSEELWHATWNRLNALRDWYLEEDKYVVDERKRPENNYDYDLLGVDGSFKKLQVD